MSQIYLHKFVSHKVLLLNTLTFDKFFFTSLIEAVKKPCEFVLEATSPATLWARF